MVHAHSPTFSAAREIERRLGEQKAGTMLPFVVIENDSGRVAGMTTYMHVDAANRRGGDRVHLVSQVGAANEP